MVKRLEDCVLILDGKKYRYGFTTGSAATAAAKAAATMLLLHTEIPIVDLTTPMGIHLTLPVLEPIVQQDLVSCAIRKDGGDDPDATSGLLIRAVVSRKEKDPGEKRIQIAGGTGVGRITRAGLEQPVGEAAINRVPREMITKELEEICRIAGYKGALSVVIEVPEGEKTAEKTFNPRLGILGGISILGTSGIVVPMSEEALIKSIEAELRMHVAQGEEELLIAPGNYGETYIRDKTDLPWESVILCSNYVGKTMDIAVSAGVRKVTYVSHIGKAIKLAGGIMDTHSRSADSRAELMTACALRAGCDLKTARQLLETVTTEEGIVILKQQGLLEKTMQIILEKCLFYLEHRTAGRLQFDIILYSSEAGFLGEIESADKEQRS